MMFRKFAKENNMYFVLGAVFLVLFFLIKDLTGDDFYYLYYKDSEVNHLGALVQFLSMRYQSWSSRLISETVILLLLSLGMTVWRIFTVGCVLIVVFCIKYLSGIKNVSWQNLALCMLMAAFPICYYNSAGWVTTTSVYLMSAAFGLIALCPIRKWMDGKEIVWWEATFCLLSAVIASNHEQVCAILLGAYLCVCVYEIILQHTVPRLFLGIILVCVISVIFILTCTGNSLRTASETETWLPVFADWTLWEKLIRGILHTADFFFYDKNINFVCLFLMFIIGILVLQRAELLWKKVLSVVGVVWVCSSMGLILLQRAHIIGETAVFRWGPHGENMLSSKIDIYRACSALFLCLLLAMELYWLFGKSRDLLTAYLILGAGFGSVALVGFSPTIYASGNRIFMFLCYAVFLFISFLLKKFCSRIAGKNEIMILALIGFLSLGAFAKNIIYLCGQ